MKEEEEEEEAFALTNFLERCRRRREEEADCVQIARGRRKEVGGGGGGGEVKEGTRKIELFSSAFSLISKIEKKKKFCGIRSRRERAISRLRKGGIEPRMKIDKLDAVELDREDESVTSRTARLKKRISSKISKVVNRRQQQQQQQLQQQQEHQENDEEGSNPTDENGVTRDDEIPPPSSPVPEEKDEDKSSSSSRKKGSSSSSVRSPSGDFRKGSFSYLDLLEKGGGTFPHRTQTIQASTQQHQRRASFSSSTNGEWRKERETSTQELLSRSQSCYSDMEKKTYSVPQKLFSTW